MNLIIGVALVAAAMSSERNTWANFGVLVLGILCLGTFVDDVRKSKR